MQEEVPCDRSFAVIRMDPVAMVRHLNDPEATRAAEALSPRKYLVYLDEVCHTRTDCDKFCADMLFCRSTIHFAWT